MRRRTVLEIIGAVAIALLSLWAKRQATDAAIANILTSESLVTVSPTEYTYTIEISNQNPHPASVTVGRYAESPVEVIVSHWERTPGLGAQVVQNIMTGENWSIKIDVGAHESGTLTLHLRTTAPLTSPHLETKPLVSRGLPNKAWEFHLTDGGH